MCLALLQFLTGVWESCKRSQKRLPQLGGDKKRSRKYSKIWREAWSVVAPDYLHLRERLRETFDYV